MSTDSFPDAVTLRVQEYIENRHDYLSWLDTEVESLDYGRAVMRIPFDEKLTNKDPQGRPRDTAPQIHGGIAATLIDTAGGIVQRTVFDDPLSGGVATVNLNVNYLQRASGDLRATAEVVRAGSTIGVSDVTVESIVGETVEPVATGQVAYRLFHGDTE